MKIERKSETKVANPRLKDLDSGTVFKFHSSNEYFFIYGYDNLTNKGRITCLADGEVFDYSDHDLNREVIIVNGKFVEE